MEDYARSVQTITSSSAEEPNWAVYHPFSTSEVVSILGVGQSKVVTAACLGQLPSSVFCYERLLPLEGQHNFYDIFEYVWKEENIGGGVLEYGDIEEALDVFHILNFFSIPNPDPGDIDTISILLTDFTFWDDRIPEKKVLEVIRLTIERIFLLRHAMGLVAQIP